MIYLHCKDKKENSIKNQDTYLCYDSSTGKGVFYSQSDLFNVPLPTKQLEGLLALSKEQLAQLQFEGIIKPVGHNSIGKIWRN